MALQIGDMHRTSRRIRGRPDRLPRLDRRRWAVLFSHPKDFTPVCTTELGDDGQEMSRSVHRRNVKVIGLSVDPVGNHADWLKDIEETQGFAPNYPIIGDADFNVSKYGMLPASVEGYLLANPRPQPDGAQRLRHRPRQEGQARAGVPHEQRAATSTRCCA